MVHTLSISASSVVFCVSCDFVRFSFSRSCFIVWRFRSSTNFFVLLDFNSRTRRSSSILLRIFFSEPSLLLSSIFCRTWLNSRSFFSLEKKKKYLSRVKNRTCWIIYLRCRSVISLIWFFWVSSSKRRSKSHCSLACCRRSVFISISCRWTSVVHSTFCSLIKSIN